MSFKLVFISHCYHESPKGELFLKHSVVQYQMIIVLVHAAAAERDLITDSGDVLTYMAGVTRGRYCSKCYILSAS